MFSLRPRIPIPPHPRSGRAPRNTYGSRPVEEQFLVVLDRIDDFTQECNYHSDVLTWLATRRINLRRDLSFIASLITLISGGAIWAIVTDVLTSTYLQYASAFFSLAGGLCTLVATHFLDDNQTDRLLRGAGKFRTLGLDAVINLSKPAFIELRTIASDRQLSPGDGSSKSELSEKQSKEFREAADLAWARLAELHKQRQETVEFEQFVKQAEAEHRTHRADPWAGGIHGSDY